MKCYTQEERDKTIKLLDSTIQNCSNMKKKFAEGTSQHTLLINRINALIVAIELMEGTAFGQEDLQRALPPVLSIIHKAEKAQSKYEKGTSQYKRYIPLITAMYISKDFIENTTAN